MNYLPPPVVQTFHAKLNHKLNEWNEADRHFEAACAAACTFDGTFEHHMAEFRRITETWG